MRYVLGIDGGGTKTHAVVLDETGALCGEGFGGPSNYNDVGIDETRVNIRRAVAAASTDAHLGDTPMAAVFLGMASVVTAHDRQVIHRLASDLALADPAAIAVDVDCRIALAGGLTGRPGIVQIAGTGSSSYGCNRHGESWRAGGWGSLISDEGSGYWFGVEAMRAAVHAYDGRAPATILLERVLAHLKLNDINDIYQPLYVHGLSRAAVAQMAPLVIESAAAGDVAACAIIDHGMALIADCIDAVARRLGMLAEPLIEVAVTGGLMRAGELVLAPLRTAVTERLPQARLLPAELPPVLGAGILALQQIGCTLDPTRTALLRESATRLR